jgi:F-type H+-transporting ATPase subunit delta
VSKFDIVSFGAADRYANALFEIGREEDSIKKIEVEMDQLDLVIRDSLDFSDFLVSPLYPRVVQQRVSQVICKKMKLSQNLTNTVLLMASKRRLSQLSNMIKSFKALASAEREEILVEVVSAQKLTKHKMDELGQGLKKSTLKQVVVDRIVDSSILGGLVIRIGSKMIDTSIKSKLVKLKKQMKEVG